MKSIFTPPYAALVGSLSLTALSLAFSTPAEAITWNWTFTQTDPISLNAGNGSGTFTSTDTPSGGPFEITAITGSFAELGTITSLLVPNAFLGNDNSIDSLGQLSIYGVSFVVNGSNFNLYNNGSSYPIIDGPLNPLVSEGTFSATPTPVPLESDALPLVD